MDVVIEKIFPTVDQLQPALDAPDASQTIGCRRQLKNCSKSKREQDKQTSVTYQYRCPIVGCLYDSNSERHFANLNYLKQHYKKVHAKKLHLCHKCPKAFAKSSDLVAHEAVCGTIYRCNCGVSYSTREALLTHSRRKGHALLEEFSVNRRSSSAAPTVRTVTTSTVKSVVPAMVVVVNHFLGGAGTISPPVSSAHVTPAATQRPCFILPKSAPIHSVPLPTVAAMALSELSSGTGLVRGGASTAETATQTEDGGRRSVGCSPSKRSSVEQRHHSRRATKRSAETQTATSRKQPRSASGRCCATQTRARKAVAGKPTTKTAMVTTEDILPSTGKAYPVTYSFEETGTQTLALYRHMIDSIEGETAAGGDWSLSDMSFAAGIGVVSHGSSAMELEVDINFQLSAAAVSSATQTSPRVRMQQRQQGLLTSLRGFLTSMGDAEDQNSVAGFGGDMRRCQLSSHTQTETDNELNRLLLGASDSDEEEGAVGGILSCTDIHTQTTEDLLHDIPYEQLLSSHMETQTSDEDALFSELSGCLCDIQTQTTLPDYEGDDDLVGGGHSATTVVDIHTQTPHAEDLFWRAPLPQPLTNHTETQTFPSLLDMCYDSALTDSHTQTPGNWSNDLLDAQLLFQ